MKAAIAQTGSVLFDTAATLRRVEHWCREAASAQVDLLVFPEALVGGYPKGLGFGVTVGNRSADGRDLFARYFRSAIECPGPETEAIAALSQELNLHIVIGVIERAKPQEGGGTLYCSSLLFTPQDGLAQVHRKLMPTGAERLIWGQGDATGLAVTPTAVGRVGMAICWENYMPLLRQHLYTQGVELWCAPTVDARPTWPITMRHIAMEGRCFVLSACQWLTKEDWPEELREEGGTIEGGSIIVNPHGDILAGPLQGEGLLVAEIDTNEIARGKFDLDVAGHYQRPDIFQLTVHNPPAS